MFLIAAIVEGFGSLGSGIVQRLIPLAFDEVFYIFIGSLLFQIQGMSLCAAIALAPIAWSEYKLLRQTPLLQDFQQNYSNLYSPQFDQDYNHQKHDQNQ